MSPEIRLSSVFLQAFQELPRHARRQVKESLQALFSRPDTIDAQPIQGAPDIYSVRVNPALCYTFETGKDKTLTLRVLGEVESLRRSSTSDHENSRP